MATPSTERNAPASWRRARRAHVCATHLPHQGLTLVEAPTVVEEEIDIDAVTATWPDDPWRALLAEVRGLEDVLQGVVYQGAEGRDGGELVGAVQRQLQETLARAASLPALRPVLALATTEAP